MELRGEGWSWEVESLLIDGGVDFKLASGMLSFLKRMSEGGARWNVAAMDFA